MDEKMEIRLVNPTEDGFLQKIDWNKWIKGREKKMGHCSYRVNHAECRRTDARAFVFSRE